MEGAGSSARRAGKRARAGPRPAAAAEPAPDSRPAAAPDRAARLGRGGGAGGRAGRAGRAGRVLRSARRVVVARCGAAEPERRGARARRGGGVRYPGRRGAVPRAAAGLLRGRRSRLAPRRQPARARAAAACELDKGAASEWAPLLSSLPDVRSFGDLPWLWGLDAPEGDAAAVAAVASTELELPVRRKLQRLRREHAALGAAGQQVPPLALNARACGVVLPHLNPWFGTKIVPFNDILNCPEDPAELNVEFALAASAGAARRKRRRQGGASDARAVVGRAVRDVAQGAELLQSDGGSEMATPDLAFRCGFVLERASLRSDVVSIAAEDLLAGACEASRQQARAARAGRPPACSRAPGTASRTCSRSSCTARTLAQWASSRSLAWSRTLTPRAGPRCARRPRGRSRRRSRRGRTKWTGPRSLSPRCWCRPTPR
jgi:hypothetical protein